MKKLTILFILLIILSPLFWRGVGGEAFSQNDSIPLKPAERKPVLCEIKMFDGSTYKGFIEKQTDTLIYLKSSSGVLIHVPKKHVLSIDFINGHTTKDSTGNITIHIPSISHNYYVASSNAFLLKKGEVYGSSSYFLFYNINYAFNQHFSLGVSSSFLAAPIAVHAKANFEISHKLFLGVDGLFGSGSWVSPKSYGGGGVLKLTYGDAKDNFTVSGGYGDIDYFMQARRGRRGWGGGRSSYYQNETSAIIGAAFSYAISEKFHFVAEAFAAPNVVASNKSNAPQVGIYSFSPAIRTSIKPNISWVFGLNGVFYTATNKGGTNNVIFALPYIGFSFRL
ncbi:MAG: hypothetical protein ACYDCN_08580 [Bacteroidia bacterium]